MREIVVAVGMALLLALTLACVTYAVLLERRLRESHPTIWQDLVGRSRADFLNPLTAIRAFRFVFFVCGFGWLKLRDDPILARYGFRASTSFVAAMFLIVVVAAINGGPVNYHYP
jgi:hypothetical protein